jgi:hypothetical protein
MYRCHSVCILSFVGLAVAMTGTTLAANKAGAVAAEMGSFEPGEAAPAGWTLSGGQGRRVEGRILEVTGNGTDSNVWRHDYPFVPGGLYRFQVHARRMSGSGGCAVAGASFANTDYGFSEEWRWYGSVFRAPENVGKDAFLRIGHWNIRGSLQFDAVRIVPVLPVYTGVGRLRLGNGEAIRRGRYSFSNESVEEGGNFHRPLLSSMVGYNTDRWGFGGDGQVVYRFHLPGQKFRNGKVVFTINYHTQGGCVAEVSRDGQSWRKLGARNSEGDVSASLPADLLPAETVYLRLRTANAGSSFQVNHVGFSGDLSDNPPDVVGRTAYAEIDKLTPTLSIEDISCDDSSEPARPVIRLTANNRGSAACDAAFSVGVAGQPADAGQRQAASLTPGQSHTFTATVPLRGVGAHQIRLSLAAAGEAMTASLSWHVPEYFRDDFGRRIGPKGGGTDLWWCEAAWKIAPQRPAPSEQSAVVSLSAARNDHEAVQIVVRPRRPLKQLTAAAGALRGPGGATIAAKNIQVLRVYYHHVHTPTDRTGVVADWPDALPPLSSPIDVPAGRNQPLWVLVRVPKDAPAGDYAGEVRLRADGLSVAVPLSLHVWNFTLPERNHIESAFGLSPETIFRYHYLKSEADKRRVMDMYLQCFADHRISPYNPTPFDPIRTKFLADANPPRAEIDFSAFDAAMSRALARYHFTNFVLPVEGMGSGTYEGRNEPGIGRFGEHTPQYQAMFASNVKQLESHLRQKGWLNMAYTYWFDEPAEKDFAFVQAGMDRIKKYAPGIQTMITKEGLQPDWKGKMDIWCPLSPNYNEQTAQKRRAHGDRYWWYVCCGPKAPFCTLFIDHPATDLRVWLWQTWQRGIGGVLIWESVYWTSREDLAQNPYEDPTGYVGGTRPEEKQIWGNGDGRFLYPPLAAAQPDRPDKDPVLEPPVSSIRWEMLREGVEDYEYLWLLRDLIGRKAASLTADERARYESLLKVPTSITRDMTTFTTDPRPVYARRAAIAAAIEELGK